MEQPPSAVSSDDRTWGMLAHLLAAGGHFLVILSWLGPLIVWSPGEIAAASRRFTDSSRCYSN